MHSIIKGSRFTKTLPAETSVTRGSYGGGAEEASSTQESRRVAVPAGRAVVISRGDRRVEPVVVAMPHQAGMPEPIRAHVKVVSAPSQQHVPFTWVKKSFQSPPSRPTKTVEEKYFDHAARTAQAQTVNAMSMRLCNTIYTTKRPRGLIFFLNSFGRRQRLQARLLRMVKKARRASRRDTEQNRAPRSTIILRLSSTGNNLTT